MPVKRSNHNEATSELYTHSAVFLSMGYMQPQGKACNKSSCACNRVSRPAYIERETTHAYHSTCIQHKQHGVSDSTMQNNSLVSRPQARFNMDSMQHTHQAAPPGTIFLAARSLPPSRSASHLQLGLHEALQVPHHRHLLLAGRRAVLQVLLPVLERHGATYGSASDGFTIVHTGARMAA